MAELNRKGRQKSLTGSQRPIGTMMMPVMMRMDCSRLIFPTAIVYVVRHPSMRASDGEEVSREGEFPEGTVVNFYLNRTPSKSVLSWRVGYVGLYRGSLFLHCAV